MTFETDEKTIKAVNWAIYELRKYREKDNYRQLMWLAEALNYRHMITAPEEKSQGIQDANQSPTKH